MTFRHNIGLHLRLKTSLSALVEEAYSYHPTVTSFQFFLVKQKTGKYVTIGEKDKAAFFKAQKDFFSDIYIHCSYWINPSSSDKEVFTLSKKFLKKEIRIAKMLGVEYLVLHAGSAKGHPLTKQDSEGKMGGIKSTAKMLNSVLKEERSVQVLLENTAYGKRTIGSNLEDFLFLKKELDYPEKVGFCVDFAHAFSYGYDLEPVDDFVGILDKCLGLNSVKLIHFNDLKDNKGSMQDHHAFPGQGKIGKSILQKLLNHPSLISIPKIVEGPVSSAQEACSVIDDIMTW